MKENGFMLAKKRSRRYLAQTITGCSLKELPEAMDDWDGWPDRETETERDIESHGTPCNRHGSMMKISYSC